MSLLPWLVVALLVAVNALYVGAEFSAVAVQRSALSRLAADGNTRARGLLSILEDGRALDRYIAACQIGITLSSLVVGAYGQATIAVDAAPLLARAFGLDALGAASLSAVLVLLLLTALQVLLGELVPKSLALQYPARSALFTYLPTRWSVTLYRPFIWLLNGSGLLLLRPFGVSPGGHQHVHSPDEIELLLAESRKGGGLPPAVHQRLQRGLHLSQRTARQLMVPRAEIVAVEVATPAPELLATLRGCPYSRLPVYRGSLDEILGTVDIKDVVGRFAEEGSLPPLAELVRPIPFAPEHLSADRLVRFLQERHASKAIVVDEFGGVQGIVSIEDVLGELFGEVADELKELDTRAERLSDGRLRLPGALSLVEAERWLGTQTESSAATLGGYVIEALGRLPEAGETVALGDYELTVAQMGERSIAWIEARRRERGEVEA